MDILPLEVYEEFLEVRLISVVIDLDQQFQIFYFILFLFLARFSALVHQFDNKTVFEDGLHDRVRPARTGDRSQGQRGYRHGAGGRHATRRLRAKVSGRYRHG